MINVSGTAKFLGSAALTCLSVAFFLLSDTTSFSAYGETEKDNDPQTAHKKCIEDWGRLYAEFEHKCLVWGRDKTIVIEADCAAAGKRLKATKNEIDSLGDMKIITGMTSYGAGLDSESLASEQQQLDNKVKDAERRLKQEETEYRECITLLERCRNLKGQIQSIATSCSDLEAKIKAGKQPRPPQAAADRCPEDAPTKNISVIISGPAGAVKKGGSPVSFTASPSDGGSYSFDWTVARKGGGSKKSDNHTKTLTLNPTQEGDFIITVELLRRCRNGKTVKLSSSYPLKVEAGGSGNCDLICNEDADVKKGKLTSGRCSEICRECAGRSDFANCMYFKKKVKKMDPEEARKLHESFGGK